MGTADDCACGSRDAASAVYADDASNQRAGASYLAARADDAGRTDRQAAAHASPNEDALGNAAASPPIGRAGASFRTRTAVRSLLTD
jgi:hypothetical protein